MMQLLKVIGEENIPCMFLDPLTRRCIHYEHRPEICREFEVGSYACLQLRSKAGLPLLVDD